MGITIQSIELVNFMCHDTLKIVFEKMITCLCGRNGTGKSAVMVSLGILFGQRAQALERGNSFKSLIKTGCNQATIRVAINNYLGYRADRYGSQIVVEKRLRHTGSKISIYNQQGRIFNARKGELVNIINKYGLKFDNPLNFLTQDKGKRFLNLAKPELLYEFYYEGTEFKDIQEELEASLGILQEMATKVQELSVRQDSLEAKLHTQMKNLEFLDFDVDGAFAELDSEDKWRKVVEMRRRLSGLTEEIELKSQEVASLRKERKSVLELSSIELCEESTKDICDRIDSLTLQYHRVSNEYQEFIKDREDCMAEIERVKKRSKVESIALELKNTEDLLDARSRQMRDLERQKEKAQDAMQAERSENEEKKPKLYALRKQMEYFKQNMHDQIIKTDLDNFKRIEEEMRVHSFSDLVLGPVSKYVRLKEQKWFKPVSIVLKKSLTNYIVFNNDDKVKLLVILKKLNINYSITQMSSKKIYKNLQTNSSYKTILDVLDVVEGLVLSQLIMLNNIEQTILIDKREAAHRVIRSNPSHVDCAYTLMGDRIKMVNGSLSDFRPRDDGSCWFEDRASKLAKYESKLAELSICENQRMRYDEIRVQIECISNESMRLERRCKDLRLELEMLHNLKENSTDGLERKLLVLEKSISSLLNRREALERQIKEAEEQKTQILEANDRKRREYTQVKEGLQLRLSKIDCDIMASESVKASRIQEKRDLGDRINEEVRALGVEPKTIRSSEEIAKERAFLNDFRRQVKCMESREIIEIDVGRLEIELVSVRSLREKFGRSVQETTEAYEKRICKRDQIKRKDAEESAKAFKEYTMRGGYDGEMYVDHEGRRLDIRMRTHNSLVGGPRSTLSGGERSFAGVCFLLSMWKCFKCPVRILDEFDVFMDSLNRRTAIKFFFEFFKESKMQIILITPLDTEDLMDPECDIKVLQKDIRDRM